MPRRALGSSDALSGRRITGLDTRSPVEPLRLPLWPIANQRLMRSTAWLRWTLLPRTPEQGAASAAAAPARIGAGLVRRTV